MNSGAPPLATTGHDRGAALIVAIAFMVMIGAVAAGLSSMVTSGVANRIALDELRDRQYAADGAVETAVVAMRSAIDAAAVGCGSARTDRSELDGIRVRVDSQATCVAVVAADGLPVRRIVGDFHACVDDAAICTPERSIVSARLTFELDARGIVVSTSVTSWSVLR